MTMSKQLDFDTTARNGMKAGIDKLADMVKVTLGAKGRFVTIEQSGRPPHTTKDGVTVAKNISFSDRLENMGCQMAKSVAAKTADDAGDGTTTATVLAQALVSEGIKNVTAGANPMDLKRGIDIAVEAVVNYLEGLSKEVTTNEEIVQVATISANNDEFIGSLIGQAMEKVSAEGTITVEQSKSMDTYVDIVEGTKFHRGYLSPAFVTDDEKMECVMEDALVFLTPNKIENVQQIVNVLQATQGQPILIIAGEVSGEATATLAINKVRGGMRVAAIKAPFLASKMKYTLEDIAVLTGATVVSEEKGIRFDQFQPEMFGQVSKVIIDKESTILIGGYGDQAEKDKRESQIRTQLKETTNKVDEEELEERLSTFLGGVAVIYVGGNSEVEIKEKIDRVDDALGATKAASAEGIVMGGGVALLHAREALKGIAYGNDDQRTGGRIVKKAIEAPFRQIMTNAGLEGSIIMDGVMTRPSGTGYDVKNDEYVEMFEAGIIDPKKVTRVALENAASIASLILMTGGTITQGLITIP